MYVHVELYIYTHTRTYTHYTLHTTLPGRDLHVSMRASSRVVKKKQVGVAHIRNRASWISNTCPLERRSNFGVVQGAMLDILILVSAAVPFVSNAHSI